MNSELTEIGKIIKKGEVRQQEPLSEHTTFRVGGPARLFVTPAGSEEAALLLAYLRSRGTEHFVIGNGSNLLCSDRGYDGVIIDLGSNDGTEFSLLGVDDEAEDGAVLFDCGAGCRLSSLSSIAAKQGAAGLEALGGIPGCIGGACIMNAGAYGSEMKDVVRSLEILTAEGERKTITASEAAFGYRHSKLMEDGSIVLRAELLLQKGDTRLIEEKCREYADKRREKQPLEYPSAGSTFKRPEGAFAGKLIEDAGLKGLTVGGAQVSEKHAGFIINRNRASAEDIYRLICRVQKEVADRSGILLETEVRMLGSF